MNLALRGLFAFLAFFLCVSLTPAEDEAEAFTIPATKRYIEVNLTTQYAKLWDTGQVLWESKISSGRDEKPTKPGSFEITDKHADWTSTIYRVPMPYFLRLNGGEVGLHAGLMTFYPGSAGCIRLPKEKARELFNTVDVGTKVVIYGKAPLFAECMKRYKESQGNSGPYSRPRR